MSDKKKKTYSEIDYDQELSFYYFKEFNEEGKLIETYENLNQAELQKLRKRLVDEAEGKPKSAKTRKKQREQEIDEIDGMMNSLVTQFEENNTPAPQEVLPARPTSPPYNFVENRSKAETKAAALLKELLQFYLSDEYISDNQYIKAKIALDQMSLSGLINQLQLSEVAIQKLMESIDSGESHPRMFEVLAGMQRVYIDLMKMQALSVIATEEHVKKLRNDFDYYQGGPAIEAKAETKEITEGSPVRGTKNFLKDLQNEGADEDQSE